MKEIMMKARAGVTLVELLVVILIVTILSVSMLPLLQPFVTEAQYAAEAIPVIGNLRTKVGVYSYDKGELPYTNAVAGANVIVQTWRHADNDEERFQPARYDITASTFPDNTAKAQMATMSHIQGLLKVDYEDLKGKRSRPIDYYYYPISAVNNQSYVVACFGNGDGGLKAGTGYAVCELNFTTVGKKYIGVWKQYKPRNEGGPLFITNDQDAAAADDSGRYAACYVPDEQSFNQVLPNASDTTEPQIVGTMRGLGWEF